MDIAKRDFKTKGATNNALNHCASFIAPMLYFM